MAEMVSFVVHSTGVADRAYSPVAVIQECSRHAAPLEAQRAPHLRRGHQRDSRRKSRYRMHRGIPEPSSVCVGMAALATADETVEGIEERAMEARASRLPMSLKLSGHRHVLAPLRLLRGVACACGPI